MLAEKEGRIVCGAGCGFSISEQRMQEVVSSIVEAEIDEDNWNDSLACTFCGSPLCDGTC